MDLETFLEHFETIAEAPGGIAKLKALILDLAVRGKLIPQNPEDEPVSDLLKKIEDAKCKLIELGHIRKSSKVPLNGSKIPHKTPKNWRWVKFDDVILNIEAGTSPQCEKRTREKHEWGIIKISAISWDKFNPMENKALPIRIQPLKEFEIKVGDFLMSRANTSQLVGKSVVVESTPPRLLLNDKTLRVVFPKFLEKRFFNLYNNSFSARQYFASEGTGTSDSMKNITREQIRNLPVPVPPLAEQKRIVEKVDELMALCDRFAAAKQTRDDLRQKLRGSAIAALMNAETDEALEKSWAIVRNNWHSLSQDPKDVDDLRRSILQLAVQGKLTVQDPTDQSALLLASQIKEGKNHLAKPRQFSKPVYNPFEIPSNWVWLKTGDFYDVSGGIQKTPKRAPVLNYFPYLRVANVQRGYLDLEEIEYFELLDSELERWNLQSGDLLIVEGNGSSKEIGRCAIWNGEIEKCVHQNHIIRARPIGHSSQLFTLMFLNSPSGMAEMRNLAITTSGLYSLRALLHD